LEVFHGWWRPFELWELLNRFGSILPFFSGKGNMRRQEKILQKKILLDIKRTS